MLLSGRIRRIGGCLVVTVPQEVADRLDLNEGDVVTIDIQKAEVPPLLGSDLQRLAEDSWERNEDGYRYLAGR